MSEEAHLATQAEYGSHSTYAPLNWQCSRRYRYKSRAANSGISLCPARVVPGAVATSSLRGGCGTRTACPAARPPPRYSCCDLRVQASLRTSSRSSQWPAVYRVPSNISPDRLPPKVTSSSNKKVIMINAIVAVGLNKSTPVQPRNSLARMPRFPVPAESTFDTSAACTACHRTPCRPDLFPEVLPLACSSGFWATAVRAVMVLSRLGITHQPPSRGADEKCLDVARRD